MASIRSRWAVGLMAVSAAILLMQPAAGRRASAPDDPPGASTPSRRIAAVSSNRDTCAVASSIRFYGASNEKCPKYKWNPLKGCQADGCCCLDACSEACRKAYCVLKQQWSIDPSNYCGESIVCRKEWACGGE